MKIKFYKCPYCGEKVFKRYYEGKLRINQERVNKVFTKEHTCFWG